MPRDPEKRLDSNPASRGAAGGKPHRTLVEPRPARGDARSIEEERAARKRVAALVAGGLHFKVKRTGDQIQAGRGAGAPKLWARLSSKSFTPEHTLDLRGRPLPEIGDAIAAFLGHVHRRGVKHVLVPFADAPRGDPSREPSAQAMIDALTRGSAAPIVRAFASAHDEHGGVDALAVLLV